MYWWDNQLFAVKTRQMFLWRMTSRNTRIFYCSDMKNESNCYHKKTKWVNFVRKQDLYMLLKWDNVSWRKTLVISDNFIQWFVVNTFFQDVMDHHNQEDWLREIQKSDPYWKSSYLYGKHEIEIRIWSLRRDNSHSGVSISHVSNKFVIDSSYNNTEVPADLSEEQALQSIVKIFATRSKAKVKPQRRELVDVPSIIPMNERKWIDIEPG